MKMYILKILKYKGYNIYIRHYLHIFEYLVVFNNKIYSHYYEAKPQSKPYTEDQLSDNLRIAIGAAKQTIRQLLKKQSKKSK